MGLVKSVSPTGPAAYGDTLTYSLVATATGTLDEHNVVVSDVVPDHTTYVDGSASCVDTPACSPSYDAASHTVHWAIGDMPHGSVGTVTFQVTIDKPNTASVPAETITNVGSVATDEDPSTPSNEVKTQVTAVLGLHETVPPPATSPATLPVTGRATGLLALIGLALIGVGTALTTCARPSYQHRH
jgi:uncharacterized repeat protein (TIGR01451 family)